jgi:hypothetical protein
VSAQTADQEVFLQFRHEGVVNTFVSSIYYQDRFYLSVSDLFNALSIDLNIDTGRMQLSGNFIGRGEYLIRLDSRTQTAQFDGRTLQLSADDYILSDLGYYLSPEIYYELFGMEFMIDFNNLVLTLESENTMPVVAQRERERQRERMLRTQRELRRDFFPLLFGRNQQSFYGGFFDYNLTGSYNDLGSNFLYNTSLGTELLGGDLQGTVFGNVSENTSAIRSSGLRWRYGILNNPWISSVTAGQTTSLGLLPVSYTGIKLTNEPLEPRFLYGETAFTGTVEPGSEVELYRNNSLVDYVMADETGLYRFMVPITYGASNYSVRVYEPTGQVSTRDVRLQVPFNFLPPGEINYTFDAGRLDNPIAGSTDRGFMSKADITAGLTNRFSAIAGAEYFEDFHDGLPTLKAGLSSRLFDNYLLSVEAASQAFYRASGSVIYPSNASISLDYTRFNRQGGIYNPARNISSWRTNLFLPFEIGRLPLFVRFNLSNENRELSSVSRYRVDLNTRLGRANLRLGYRDTQVGRFTLASSPVARVTASATYNVSRSRTVPTLLRGVFLRAQTNYLPSFSQFEDAEIQISRNVRQTGRLQISLGRNFTGDFNLFRFGFTVDFSSVRSVTTVRSTRTASAFTQSLRGSIGYDPSNKKTIFTNRQQVGRSGTAVRLFVDRNNSGVFEAEEDELIPENAIRIDRAGGIPVSKDSIHYLSQLQPYRQYNMSIIKSVITNPLLVPELENFSFITDPNQYKIIDVPFYTSGIVEGVINRTLENGTLTGLGGLRLFMRQVNVPEGVEPFEQELRTFSDGSFYAYEIPPGDYVIEPDSTQLAFLDAEPDIEQIEFTIAPLSEGDFVEGLAINLEPEGYMEPDEAAPRILASLTERPGDSVDVSGLFDQDGPLILQAASFMDFGDALRFAEQAETAAGIPFDIAFNSRNELYTVRTSDTLPAELIAGALSDLSLLAARAPALIRETQADTAAVQTDAKPYIQLGVFLSLEAADSFIETQDFALPYDLTVYTDPQKGVYRVLNGAYGSDTELFDSLQRITLSGSPEEVEPEPGLPRFAFEPDYRYSLSLGQFSNADSAQAFIDRYSDQVNVTLTMVQLDSGAYEVSTEEQTGDWSGLINLGADISSVTNMPPPVARILPTLPAKQPGDTAAVDDGAGDRMARIDSTRFRPVELDLAELPADTLIASGMDTLVIRNSGTPVIEILEEEEFIVQPSDTSESAQDAQIIRPEDAPVLEQCTFPVQVGSFGGNRLAREVADSISERIGTEITLYYNEVTDLFALRTEGYESLNIAADMLRRFRTVDPYNQYAIVGQCIPEGSDAVYKPARYLVSLGNFASREEAETYSDTLTGDIRESILIRSSGDGGPVTVYYGPFDRYDSAVVARDSLAGSGTADNPVIVLDPETRNRFRLQFRVFLGTYGQENPIEEIAGRLEQVTGRRVTIRIDDVDAAYLFEENVYGLWSRFLDELDSITGSTSSTDSAEIFIIDE